MPKRTLVCDTTVLLYLIMAKRAGLVSMVRPQLDALRLAGFRMTEDLYRGALRLAGEAID